MVADQRIDLLQRFIEAIRLDRGEDRREPSSGSRRLRHKRDGEEEGGEGEGARAARKARRITCLLFPAGSASGPSLFTMSTVLDPVSSARPTGRSAEATVAALAPVMVTLAEAIATEMTWALRCAPGATFPRRRAPRRRES